MRLGLALLLAATCAPGVEIQRTASGKLDLDARAASVESILNCMAERTGMKLVRDGVTLPRQPLTLSLRDRTEVEVVYSLFEGLGLNYALSMDPSQSRVLMLLLSGSGSDGASRRPPPVVRIPRDEAPAPETATTQEQPPQVMPQGGAGSPFAPGVPAPGLHGIPGMPPSQSGMPPTGGGAQPQPDPTAPDTPTTPERATEELFPEQRPLTSLSLRGAGRVHSRG